MNEGESRFWGLEHSTSVIAFFFFFRAALSAYGSSQLGVESELQLLGYTTATAMQHLSHVFDLRLSSWQRHVLNPLREARDQTCNLMVPSRAHYC